MDGPTDTLSGGWGDAQLPELTARFGHPLNDSCEYASQCVVGALLNAESQLAERDAQIAEMRKVTGPKCPKCGHWLRAEHGRSFNPPTCQNNYYCKHRDGKERCECEFPIAELGLTEANDAR